MKEAVYEPLRLLGEVRPAGEFRTFDEWADKAHRRLSGAMGVACFDQKGRLCTVGYHFMRARDENAFPVVYFFSDWIPRGAQ